MDKKDEEKFPSEHNKDFKPRSISADGLTIQILKESPYYKLSRDRIVSYWPLLAQENLDRKDLELLLRFLDTGLFHGLLLGSHGRLVRVEGDIFAPVSGNPRALTISDSCNPPHAIIWLCGSLDRDYRKVLKLDKLFQLRLLIHEMCHAYIELYWNYKREDAFLVEGKDDSHGYIFWMIYNHIIGRVRTWSPEFNAILTVQAEDILPYASNAEKGAFIELGKPWG
ncbi:hypothetical protein F5Y04DRAFT_275949 [Hypomontagnella monticulosa]|nr:hypothetical protein F5Y04DRAFT_275949 [Hypomontagnella monticulosa]